MTHVDVRVYPSGSAVWVYRWGSFATGQRHTDPHIVSTVGIGTFSTGQHTIKHRRG